MKYVYTRKLKLNDVNQSKIKVVLYGKILVHLCLLYFRCSCCFEWQISSMLWLQWHNVYCVTSLLLTYSMLWWCMCKRIIEILMTHVQWLNPSAHILIWIWPGPETRQQFIVIKLPGLISISIGGSVADLEIFRGGFSFTKKRGHHQLFESFFTSSSSKFTL